MCRLLLHEHPVVIRLLLPISSGGHCRVTSNEIGNSTMKAYNMGIEIASPRFKQTEHDVGSYY
jgi:hypothetical protein